MSDIDLGAETENLRKHFNYLSKYVQMSSLSTAYRDYRLRNELQERRLRETLKETPRPIRVSYFVHIIDQLSYPLVDALLADPLFEIRLLVRQTTQMNYLRQKGYPTYLVHSLWDKHPEGKPSDEDIHQADICISEMPYGVLPSLEHDIRPWMISGGWLPKYREIFTLEELNSALFCCIQYAFTLANEWSWLKSSNDFNVHYNLPYNNFSWLYFLETQAHLDHALERNFWGNTSNYAVTGYPKYDVYFEPPHMPLKFRWLFSDGSRKRIVYAPHFYRSDKFIAQTCEILLRLADTGKFEIVFKPHPNENKIVNSFIPHFEGHSNAQIVRNSDCTQYMFATADLAIISSVSMHADAVFADIPFISELGPENFSHIGRKVQNVGYTPSEHETMVSLIEKIIIGGHDPKQQQRRALRAEMSPLGGRSASENILQTIKARLEIREGFRPVAQQRFPASRGAIFQSRLLGILGHPSNRTQ